MTSCKDLVENADAYLERTLSPWDRGQIRVHLWLCRHCREYMKQLRATINALRAMPLPEGPPLAPPVREELMTSFRSVKATPDPGDSAPDG